MPVLCRVLHAVVEVVVGGGPVFPGASQGHRRLVGDRNTTKTTCRGLPIACTRKWRREREHLFRQKSQPVPPCFGFSHKALHYKVHVERIMDWKKNMKGTERTTTMVFGDVSSRGTPSEKRTWPYKTIFPISKRATPTISTRSLTMFRSHQTVVIPSVRRNGWPARSTWCRTTVGFIVG